MYDFKKTVMGMPIDVLLELRDKWIPMDEENIDNGINVLSMMTKEPVEAIRWRRIKAIEETKKIVNRRIFELTNESGN